MWYPTQILLGRALTHYFKAGITPHQSIQHRFIKFCILKRFQRETILFISASQEQQVPQKPRNLARFKTVRWKENHFIRNLFSDEGDFSPPTRAVHSQKFRIHSNYRTTEQTVHNRFRNGSPHARFYSTDGQQSIVNSCKCRRA